MGVKNIIFILTEFFIKKDEKSEKNRLLFINWII